MTVQQDVGRTDRVVAYLLATLGIDHWAGKRSQIHSAFYEACKRYRPLLAGLCFTTDGPVPYSKTLERILFRLANAGLIAELNPSYTTMSMSDRARADIIARYGNELESEVPRELQDLLKRKLAAD